MFVITFTIQTKAQLICRIDSILVNINDTTVEGLTTEFDNHGPHFMIYWSIINKSDSDIVLSPNLSTTIINFRIDSIYNAYEKISSLSYQYNENFLLFRNEEVDAWVGIWVLLGTNYFKNRDQYGEYIKTILQTIYIRYLEPDLDIISDNSDFKVIIKNYK